MQKPLVLDVGSHELQIGIAGEEEPRIIIPTLIGVKKSAMQMRMVQDLINQSGLNLNKEIYFGEDALNRFIGLDIKRPLEASNIRNEDHLKLLVEHALFQLNLKKPLNRHVLVTCPTLATERFIMFFMNLFLSELGALGICFSSQPYLSFLANDQQITGLLVELGHSQIQLVAILKGHIIRSDDYSYGGKDVDAYFRQLIAPKISLNEPINGVAPAIFIEEMKANMCEIYPGLNLLEIKDDLNKVQKMNKPHVLPNKETLILGLERYLANEILFRSELVGKEKSIPDMIYECVEKCDKDIRAPLYQNIFIAGGLAKIPNMAERIEKELDYFLPHTIEPKVRIILDNPSISTWVGGSKLAINDKFEQVVLKATKFLAEDEIGINSVMYPTFEKLKIFTPPIHTFLSPIPEIYKSKEVKLILKFVEKSNILKFRDLADYFGKGLSDIISIFMKLLAEGRIHGEIVAEKGEFHKHLT
ncbi:MAG: hypothetical protein EAX96_19075 [Candidatus Lokiarchaeota archaeon]|nr:hypothetical protein [Candidatus Lokiarchaeota archaeon]